MFGRTATGKDFCSECSIPRPPPAKSESGLAHVDCSLSPIDSRGAHSGNRSLQAREALPDSFRLARNRIRIIEILRYILEWASDSKRRPARGARFRAFPFGSRDGLDLVRPAVGRSECFTAFCRISNRQCTAPGPGCRHPPTLSNRPRAPIPRLYSAVGRTLSSTGFCRRRDPGRNRLP